MDKPSLDTAKAGAFRFNTDTSQLEIYDGNHWTGVLATSPYQETGGTRGLVLCGWVGPAVGTMIDIVDVTSGGTANSSHNFGTTIYLGGSCSSRTRGVFGGGYASGAQDIMHYMNIACEGAAVQFGDLSSNRFGANGGSNGTRGIFFGGSTGPSTSGNGVNNIDYITIATTGLVEDFGDLNYKPCGHSCFNSPTRAFSIGGTVPGTGYVNTIEYVQTATTGRAANWGDLSIASGWGAGMSNAVRGVHSLGSPGYYTAIEYATLSTLGNTKDFGDLTTSLAQQAPLASPTRIVFCGGVNPSDNQVGSIDMVEIMSEGDATDFGDLQTARKSMYYCSNGHGGL